MSEPWTCPRCNQTWQAAEPGRCPYCIVNEPPPVTQLNPILRRDVNGQPDTRQFQSPQPQPVMDPRYAALLKAVQQLLSPGVKWLEEHGITVREPIEVVGKLIQAAERALSQAKDVARRAVADQAEAVQASALLQRVGALEQGLQQLALAVASLRQPLPSAPAVPDVPENPYPTFIMTDQGIAQLEQSILQSQSVHGETWRG